MTSGSYVTEMETPCINTKNTQEKYSEFYEMECGCRFRVIGPPPFSKSKIPAIDLDLDNLRIDCPKPYALLASGRTKMVFQLEKPGGVRGSKELKPENIEHIAGLGAVLRPGCANVVDEEGVSTTQHYYRRKNNLEPITSYHPALDPILKSTYFLLLFQEQMMKITEVIAGFSKQEADYARKSAGKKDAKEMSKVKKLFIEGAKKVGIVTEEQAKEIFSWIQESQRYSFNRSHAITYGVTSYQCAYVKSHFPVFMFTSSMKYAKYKNDEALIELRELVNDAKIFNIEVYPPDILRSRLEFSTDGKDIYYGLTDVKGIGPATALKIKEVAQIEKNKQKHQWYDFLLEQGVSLSKSIMEPLILCGAFRAFNEKRARMFAEYDAFSSLTEKEQNWIKSKKTEFSSLEEALIAVARPKKEGGGANNKNRTKIIEDLLNLLQNPIMPLEDMIVDIAQNEEKYLGIALTCTRVDGKPGERWNATCKDCLGHIPNCVVVKVQIDEVRESTIKKGKEENIGRAFAFLKISDSSCSLDIVCFANEWDQYKTVLQKDRLVEIQLEKPYNKKGNLHVKQCWPI
jgi:DNA polymerase III alpha subunit